MLSYGMKELQHKPLSGVNAQGGHKTHAAPVTIIGRILKNKKYNIFAENEENRFQHILHVNENFTVGLQDLVDGFEVVQDFGNGKWALN